MPRGTHNKHARNKDHYKWNDGAKLSSHGYVKVRVGVGHPLADPNGYAYEHLVVWVSAGNARPDHGTVIHHRNGDKTDNRIANLELMHRSRHNAIHLRERERCPSTGRLLPRPPSGRLLDGREHNERPEMLR